MPSALRMPLGLLFSALMLASPAASGRHPRNVAAQTPDDPGECQRLASRDEVLAGALLSGSLGPPGDDRRLHSVRLSGARSFSAAALWDVVGGPPSLPLSREEAIALVARLAQTGLFSAVEPRIRTLPGEEMAELDIALTENPQVRSVQVRGLSEFRTEDVLDRLLEVPAGREIERQRREVRDARTRECPAPLPPREWLARVEGGEVRGGVLWQGLRSALGRVMRYLRTRGYPLARLAGELTPAGELLVDVDEGRVGGIEVRGIDAHLAREVEMELGIRRGDVFSSGELYSALERVQRRWPFLRPDRRRRRPLPAPVLRLEARRDGGVEFRSELPVDSRPPPPGDDDERDDQEEPAPPATGGARKRGALEEEPAPPATGGARKRGALQDEPAPPATGGARKRGALQEEPAPPATGGARKRGALEDEPRARRRSSDAGDDLFDDFDDGFANGLERRHRWHLRRLVRRGAWYGFEGDTLVVHLHSDKVRATVQWVELLRHTPVTGFAPGLAATLTIYDQGDRAHLLLDGAANVNTRRPSLDATGGTFLQRLNAQERVDWLLGSRVRIPVLGIAELGGQIHTLTDTADRWRISRIDSYLYSALLNRADREYYRRSGFAAFVTAHLFEVLTLGAEYRRDRYAPLDAPPGVWSLFNRDDPRYGSAPVDEGEMGSAVFRLEYRSEKVPLHRVGSMWRNSETSLVEAEPWAIGLRTVDTLEVADRSLGGIFEFTRVVSDTSLTLETGRYDTLTLRLRGAGGRDLPLQKQEGLGGWTALRGYDFKEFRGNASLLGTLQIEGRHFGAFLDVGSVRQAGTGWLDPKPSAGALFCSANKSTCAEAAWRLDGRARLAPDFRILFSVPL